MDKCKDCGRWLDQCGQCSHPDPFDDADTFDFIAFLQSVPADMAPGKDYTWPCVKCGGIITGRMSAYNRHLHANCAACGLSVMQ